MQGQILIPAGHGAGRRGRRSATIRFVQSDGLCAPRTTCAAFCLAWDIWRVGDCAQQKKSGLPRRDFAKPSSRFTGVADWGAKCVGKVCAGTAVPGATETTELFCPLFICCSRRGGGPHAATAGPQKTHVVAWHCRHVTLTASCRAHHVIVAPRHLDSVKVRVW